MAQRAPVALPRTMLLVTVNASMFVFGMVLLLMGSLLPALTVSARRAGSLGSFPLIGILTATILVGPILDKVGAKPALAVGLALIVSGIAALPSLASYTAMAAAAFVYGLGGGILNTATNALTSDLSATGRGVALNLLGFSFSLGAIAAPLVMALAVNRFSQLTLLRGLAIAPAIVLALVLASHFPLATQPGTPLRTLLGVLKHPAVWLFGALLLFESGNENCMFVWAGRVTSKIAHVPAGRADLALVSLSIALGAGRLVAALCLKWLGSGSLLLIASAATIAGATLAFVHENLAGLLSGFAVIGLGMSPIFPTALGLIGDRFPGQTGTVFGAVMSMALIGGALGPIVGGWTAASNAAHVLAVPVACGIAISTLTLIASFEGSGQNFRAAKC